MKLKKNDVVQVISGSYKGKKGKILKVIPDKNSCIVEGVNMKVRHQRATEPGEPSGRLKKETPIRVDNLQLICPKCGKLTKVGKKSVGDGHTRICKKCSEMLDEK